MLSRIFISSLALQRGQCLAVWAAFLIDRSSARASDLVSNDQIRVTVHSMPSRWTARIKHELL